MRQVRLCWQMGAVHDLGDPNWQPTSCTGWEQDTAETMHELQLLCDAANRAYGVGSHWLDRRDVPGVRDVNLERRSISTSQGQI